MGDGGMIRNKLQQYHLPPQTGLAFTIQKGQIMRVIDSDGEQVADLVCFARQDSGEQFSAGRTIDYNNRLFLTEGHVLYSNRSRPMLSITADHIGTHTCLYAPCSQEMFEISYGVAGAHPNCLDNLNMNLAAFGLSADQIAAPFNIFLHVAIAETGELSILPPCSKAGDYIELRAEMDLIVAITACAAGACNNYQLHAHCGGGLCGGRATCGELSAAICLKGASPMFTQSENWNKMYPQAAVGVLAMSGAANPQENEALNEQKEALESALREQFAGCDRAALRALPSIQPYDIYYKRFKKSYHVLQQLESVALKGKPIPRAAALVEAMFMAELKNQLLTAGHDLAVMQMPVGVDVAQGGEPYIGIGGRELATKRGDMMIADAAGIISSIIYGPDQRTRITANTEEVLFTVYAPEGIETAVIEAHLQDMEASVRLISPGAERLLLEVYRAG